MSLSLHNAQAATIAELRTLNTTNLSENAVGIVFGATTELDKNGGIYTLKKAATNADDGRLWIKPDNILSTDPGRWARDEKYDLSNFSMGTPSAATNVVFTGGNGAPFQPNADKPTLVSLSGTLTGALGLNENITVQLSATSGGTYQTIVTDTLLIGVLGLSLARAVATIPVPKGWWCKVLRSGTAAGVSWVKTDLQ